MKTSLAHITCSNSHWLVTRGTRAGMPLYVSCVFLVAFSLLSGCRDGSAPIRLRVFLADSLISPFKAMAEAFEQENPGVELVQIYSGSVLAAKKLTHANDQADVLAVADYRVIDQLLRPKFADWSICFATNEIGIVYTHMSTGASQITSENWFEILSRPNVQVKAANPFHDPCGYWTELCWKLSDMHYGTAGAGPSIYERMTIKCGAPANRRTDAQKLLQLVEATGGIDYAFVYRSQALQHNLPFVQMPPQVGMGDPDHVEHYRQMTIELLNSNGQPYRKQGDTILFAITIPKTVRNAELAAKYVSFIIGPKGRKILERQQIKVVDQPFTYDLGHLLPEELRDKVAQKQRNNSK